MYELYAYPNTYALGVHLLLQESGAPYRVVDVKETGAIGTAAENEDAIANFKAISPHQRVPSLKLETGESLFESGAIALYLGEVLCDGKFSVSADHSSRAEYLQWLFYFSSTLQPEVMLQFHPEHYFQDSDRQRALQASSMNRLREIWPLLESRYSDGPWMFENRPTAVDFSLATVLLWPECFPTDLTAYPNLFRTLSAIEHREACKKVLRWHRRETAQSGNPIQTTLLGK